MRKILILFILIILSTFAFSQTDSLKLQFNARVTFDSISTVNDSVLQFKITGWSDALFAGYLPSGIQEGFGVFDGSGRLFRVDTVLSTTASTAWLQVVKLQERTPAEPVGVGGVFEFMTNGMIPPGVANSLNLTPVTQARLLIHNAKISESMSASIGNDYIEKLNDSTFVYHRASGLVNDTIFLAISQGGGGGGATNLTYSASPTQGQVNSDTGTDAVIPAADGTNAGLLLPAEKTAISGLSTTYFPLSGGTLTGTGGAGFVGFPQQTSNPGNPTNGFRLFANNSNFHSWRGQGNFIRILDGTLTANRTYTLPDISGGVLVTPYTVGNIVLGSQTGANRKFILNGLISNPDPPAMAYIRGINNFGGGHRLLIGGSNGFAQYSGAGDSDYQYPSLMVYANWEAGAPNPPQSYTYGNYGNGHAIVGTAGFTPQGEGGGIYGYTATTSSLNMNAPGITRAVRGVSRSTDAIQVANGNNSAYGFVMHGVEGVVDISGATINQNDLLVDPVVILYGVTGSVLGKTTAAGSYQSTGYGGYFNSQGSDNNWAIWKENGKIGFKDLTTVGSTTHILAYNPTTEEVQSIVANGLGGTDLLTDTITMTAHPFDSLTQLSIRPAYQVNSTTWDVASTASEATLPDGYVIQSLASNQFVFTIGNIKLDRPSHGYPVDRNLYLQDNGRLDTIPDNAWSVYCAKATDANTLWLFTPISVNVSTGNPFVEVLDSLVVTDTLTATPTVETGFISVVDDAFSVTDSTITYTGVSGIRFTIDREYSGVLESAEINTIYSSIYINDVEQVNTRFRWDVDLSSPALFYTTESEHSSFVLNNGDVIKLKRRTASAPSGVISFKGMSGSILIEPQ